MRWVIFVCLVACAQKAPPAIHREPVVAIEASEPVVVASSAAIAEPSPPPATAGCRHAIAPGTDIAHVSDTTLRELIIAGATGPKKARDCLGESIEYETRISPRVDRVAADATHVAVFVTVAQELGYTSHCPGFAAIVRLDHDEVVTEGVGAEQFDDCDTKNAVHTAMLDGHRALLFPHVLSTGEDGDFEMAWSVSIPDDHGMLRPVGTITSTRSMGNGSMTSGTWFDALDATVQDAGTLTVEEHWELVREDPDAGEVHGRKRTVVRAYALEGGKLVRQ